MTYCLSDNPILFNLSANNDMRKLMNVEILQWTMDSEASKTKSKGKIKKKNMKKASSSDQWSSVESGETSSGGKCTLFSVHCNFLGCYFDFFCYFCTTMP